MDETINQGCLLPLVKAVITGLMVFALLASVGVMFGWVNAWYIAVSIGFAVVLFAWVTGSRVQEEVPYYQQQLIEVPAPTVKIELVNRSNLGVNTQYFELPVDIDRLCAFASLALRGDLSEAAVTGSGGPLSRSEYAKLRAELIRRGWLAWKNPLYPAQGLILTHPGRSALHFVLNSREN